MLNIASPSKIYFYVPAADRPGVEVMPLFQDERETVRLERWSPKTAVSVKAGAGLEVLVLSGMYHDGTNTYGRWDWLRLPPGHQSLSATAGASGAVVWIKSDHLAAMS